MALQPRNPEGHLTLKHGSWVWSDEKLTLKLLLVGDAAVGKSSLIRRFVSNEFVAKYEPTIGADLSVKEVVVDDHDVAVQLWDTAGNAGNQSIGKAFYKGAQLVVLVFDLTNRKSFEGLQKHYDRILLNSGFTDLDNFPCMVLGNKRDDPEICVSLEEVEEWCRARRPDTHSPIMYVATSAKEGTNTVQAFEHLVSMALEGVRRAAPQVLHPPVSPKSAAPPPSPRKANRPDGSWIQTNLAHDLEEQKTEPEPEPEPEPESESEPEPEPEVEQTQVLVEQTTQASITPDQTHSSTAAVEETEPEEATTLSPLHQQQLELDTRNIGDGLPPTIELSTGPKGASVPSVVIVGAPNAGKSSLLQALLDAQIEAVSSSSNASLIGGSAQINKSCELQFYDTAADLSQLMTNPTFAQSSALLLVFDTSDKQSLDEMHRYWYQVIKTADKGFSDTIPCFVVGTKTDLPRDLAIADGSTEAWCAWVRPHNPLRYEECSTKSGDGITALFNSVSISAHEYREYRATTTISPIVHPETSDKPTPHRPPTPYRPSTPSKAATSTNTEAEDDCCCCGLTLLWRSWCAPQPAPEGYTRLSE